MKFQITKRRFFKIFTLVLVLTIAWGFIWSWFITKTVRLNEKNGKLKNQHAIVKNIIVTETRAEKKYWEFYAKSGEYTSNNNGITLYDVIGNFYNNKEEVVLSFKSKKGHYDEKTKKVVLDGDNLFVSRQGAQLFADVLIWQGRDADILANGNVQFIKDNQFVVKAQSASFNSTLTNFKAKGKTTTKLYSNKKDNKKYIQL